MKPFVARRGRNVGLPYYVAGSGRESDQSHARHTHTPLLNRIGRRNGEENLRMAAEKNLRAEAFCCARAISGVVPSVGREGETLRVFCTGAGVGSGLVRIPSIPW